MRCAIMQPTFLPWIGYFDLMSRVDVFVYLDNVQVEKQSWQTRNRIKTNQGELYLSAHIKNDNLLNTNINAVAIDYGRRWREKHLRGISQAYSKSPYFKEVMPLLDEWYSADFQTLADMNIWFIEKVRQLLMIDTKTVRSSELSVSSGDRGDRLINICKAVDADFYMSPNGAACYIEADGLVDDFLRNKIELAYQNYVHPVYPQQWGDFLPYMSVIDLLFNVGYDESTAVISMQNSGGLNG